MKAVNLVESLKGYSSGWVALSKDYKKVLYSGKSFISLMKKVEQENQKDNVILLPVVKNFRGFVG